jgi:hypothetical protein
VSEPLIRYIAGVVLCAVVAVAYAATQKTGGRAIALHTVKCFAAMMGVIVGVAALVVVLCSLK